MRITVTPDDGRKIRFIFPTRLILNHCTAVLAPRYLKKQGVNITRKQAVMLVKALNRYRRKHPEWVFLEVQSADGDYIKIKV